MTVATYALVVLSAAAHAYWNLLLKRSRGSQAVVGLSKIVEAVMLAPVVAFALFTDPARLASNWLLPVVGGALVMANYVLLATAYRTGDLSVAYPVSRGAILLFLPALAYATFGEKLDAIGWVSIALVLAGIVSTAPGRMLRSSTTVYAVLAAFAAACYTVWDKRAVQVLAPLDYFAAYTLLTAAAYWFALQRTGGGAALGEAWRMHRGTIVQVGVLNSVSYLLILFALRNGKASYVIALRQLSIVLGVLLGWRFLGEVLTRSRWVGIALVVAGCVLLALAR